MGLELKITQEKDEINLTDFTIEDFVRKVEDIQGKNEYLARNINSLGLYGKYSVADKSLESLEVNKLAKWAKVTAHEKSVYRKLELTLKDNNDEAYDSLLFKKAFVVEYSEDYDFKRGTIEFYMLIREFNDEILMADGKSIGVRKPSIVDDEMAISVLPLIVEEENEVEFASNAKYTAYFYTGNKLDSKLEAYDSNFKNFKPGVGDKYSTSLSTLLNMGYKMESAVTDDYGNIRRTYRMPISTRMLNNIQNDTTLGLTSTKKKTIIGIGRQMLSEGYHSAFVAGMLANIQHEGEAGFFESSFYRQGEPTYLVYMDQNYNYRNEYSDQYIMDKKLSVVYSLLKQLETNNWEKGKFGLGSVQWTGGRTKTIVEMYMKVAGKNDKITFDQVLTAEGMMISQEFRGLYSNVYSSWKSTNSSNLDSAEAAYNAGYDICMKYEVPASYATKAPTRADTAKKTYKVMSGN